MTDADDIVLSCTSIVWLWKHDYQYLTFNMIHAYSYSKLADYNWLCRLVPERNTDEVF